MSEKITCQICEAKVHAIQTHLKEQHSEVTLEEYKQRYPLAPLLSEAAKLKIEEKINMEKQKMSETDSVTASSDFETQPMHLVFGLGDVKAAKTSRGADIAIKVLKSHVYDEHVPPKDSDYVFDIALLKTVVMCVEMNLPCYLWGHAGTGKTTMIEQVFGRTNRPLVRVQHTVNTEESHILGNWVVKGGEMHYQPGWLPLAMRYGWAYLADEYDFATPHVLSVYQPILEGKKLVIKDSSEEWRVVQPHPNFRFFATGNTNGVGDETGLYQGTQVQNAANYERFAVVEKVQYMDANIEEKILSTKVGLSVTDAKNMVKFAGIIRGEKTVTMPISPRSLINAAKLGKAKGDFKIGISLAYLNRLPAVEREAASQIAQRVFG